jgi:hypothetical protein
MSVDEYANKIIECYNLKDYTVDYILICEQAILDECIDVFKFDNLNEMDQFLERHILLKGTQEELI